MPTSLSIPRGAGRPDPEPAESAPCRRPSRLLWLTALALALAAALAPAALADSKIYWANATGDELSLAGLDGGGGGDLTISGATVDTPLGIAIDPAAGKIYWANGGANEISVASLDGSGGSDLDTTGATVDSPRGVAIDPVGGKIYWANTVGNRISMANLDGSGSGADLDTTGATVNGPAGVAIDSAAGKIYWTNQGANKISVANLDGSGGGADLDTTGATVSAPLGVAIDPDSNRIYWANAGGDSISVANLDGTGDGSNLDTTGATIDTPAGVAIDPDANKIYWASFAPSGNGVISVANLDGTGDGSDLDTTGATVQGANFPAIYTVEGPGAPIINSDPDPPANDNSPEIKGSAAAGSTVNLYTTSDCSGSPVATGTAADFASPGFTVSVGDDSATTFKATATDDGGLTSDCSPGFTYVEDSTAPDTSVDSGPSGLSNDPAPSFDFSADEAGSTFECRFDSDPFAACSGPGETHIPSADLSDGAHTFEVRATDAAGNLDSTPADRSFTVDATAPALAIDSGPQGPTNEASPSFGFTAEAGASVECSIDTGSASFGPCSGASGHSPAAPLTDEDHSFRVRATDAAGNQTTRTRDFTVDTQAPATTIDTGPQGPTGNDSPSFSFSSEPGASFECRLDPGAWAPCSSPKSYSNLSDGAHTFRVRAIDAAGNVEASPPQRGFTVDTQAPDTSVDSGPSGLSNDPAPSFDFSADEAGSTFECRFDSDPFAACSGPGETHIPSADLSDGAHTFEVRATDAAGNLDSTPADRSFTVDATAPALAIDSGPQGPTNEASPSFGFTAEAGASVECSIDTGSASFGPCSGASGHSPAAPLTDEDHSFRVRATDAAGNQTTRTRDFTVDTQAPATTIDTGPQGPTGNDSPSFSFSSEPGASFECRLDPGAWAPCSSPKSYSNLSDGAHTFRVRAIDAAGNVEASPPQRGFTVEAPAPPPPPRDTTVDGSATAKKKQKQRGKRIVIKVDVTAGEALTAEASGKVTAGRKSYKLKAKKAQLGDGQKKSLKLKPKRKKDARKIAKVLKRGKRAKAKLKSVIRDGVGNSHPGKHKVKLTG